MDAMAMGGPLQLADGRLIILDPMSGQILELRTPLTITERLQAQQILGIGLTVSAAGRKSSGDQPPKSESKSDGEGGSRQTVSESRK